MHKIFCFLKGISFCELFFHGGSSLLVEDGSGFYGDNYSIYGCAGGSYGADHESHFGDGYGRGDCALDNGGGYGDSFDGYAGDSENYEDNMSLEFSND